ncbi:MAG: hypothetical protein ABIQ93_04130 [Saprospiraceae bacterium]
MKKLLPLLLVMSGWSALAQQLTHSDILLFSMTAGTDSIWRAGTPRFLTAFNRRGYNNQPSFFSNNDLYLTVQLPADSTQTDLYSLNLASQTITRVTETAVSEYSPTLMFGGQRFSAVVVNADGTQHLVSYPFDRSDNGRLEFPRVTGVGYHCWLRDTLAAIFIVGQNDAPHVLYTIGTRSQKLQRITANPGRCLLPLAGGKLAYVQKATEQTWYLKIYDPQKQSSDILVKMPAGTEDFALLPNGAYLCGSGAKLWHFRPGRQAGWQEIGDLSTYGVKNISRLTVNREGKLAVVVN